MTSILDLLSAVESHAPDRAIIKDFAIAFAAAFAGAWGAQNIAERRKRHVDLTAELRETNAAVALAATVFSVLTNMKEQHIACLRGNFHLTKRAVEFQRRIPKDQQQPFDVRFDMRTISLPSMPIDRLRSIVFERITITGRGIQLASMLMLQVEELKISCSRRNELIAGFRELSKQQVIERYFGFRDADGNTDENYPNAVEAMYFENDCAMFFSWLLCRDLSRHSKSIARSLRRWPWQKIKNVHYASFAPAEEKGLMPPFEGFNDWTGYKRERPQKRTRWFRFKRRVYWTYLKWRRPQALSSLDHATPLSLPSIIGQPNA
ncbi:hypothetical protein [Hyphomicrobium sp. 2TAF46]|uniref:hypothetical protein n=1 Tax=Hyphomicrobium sp. 2TAF46 TaxID=3233019 RepID=UPI003F8F7A5A